MPAVTKYSWCVTVSAIVLVSVMSAPTAFAGGRGEGGSRGSTDQQANVDGSGTVSVAVGGVVFDRSKNGSGDSVGPVTSATSWSPPACWYAPKFNPQELQDYLEPIWEAESTGYEWDAKQREKYNAKDEKKGFNKDKTGKGYWWGSYVNESAGRCGVQAGLCHRVRGGDRYQRDGHSGAGVAADRTGHPGCRDVPGVGGLRGQGRPYRRSV